MDAGVQQTNDNLRRTYDQLVEIRNRQLRYMATIRKDGTGGLGNVAFLMTPDLICQYNYVHRLMKSLYAPPPNDICTADGGIMCSNLEVLLKPEQAVANAGDPRRRFPASYDGADYIASRIIDLLDRPITAAGDEADSTAVLMNTRDEFAANIRTLAVLFEERYRLCRERGDRLQEKLTTAARGETKLVPPPTSAATVVEERTILVARERAARYETQLREVGERLDALRVTNENTVQRGRHLVAELNRRVANLSDGIKTIGEAYSRIVHSLFVALEGERERMSDIARRIRQEELAASTVAAAEQVELLRAGYEKQMADSAATLSRECDQRTEREVGIRVAALERSMRADMEEELKRRTAAAAGDAAAAAVDRYKWTNLDGVFKVKRSAFDKIPAPPRYALPNNRTDPDADARLVHSLYSFFEILFTRLWDMYRFLLIQSGYIDSLVSVCESNTTTTTTMTAAAGIQRFNETVEKITADRASKSGQHENRLLETMHRIHEELPNLKAVFERFYNSRHLRETTDRETIARLENTIQDLRKKELESRLSVDVGGDVPQQQGVSELSAEVIVLRSMVRQLQMSLSKYVKADDKSSSSLDSRITSGGGGIGERMVKQSVLELERSYRKSLQIDARHAYNELVSFTQELGADFRRWFDEANGDRKHAAAVPAVLSNFDWRLKDMTSRADIKFNFAASPLSPPLTGKTAATTTSATADGSVPSDRSSSDANRQRWSRTHPYWKSKQHHARDRSSAHRKRASQ